MVRLLGRMLVDFVATDLDSWRFHESESEHVFERNHIRGTILSCKLYIKSIVRVRDLFGAQMEFSYTI